MVPLAAGSKKVCAEGDRSRFGFLGVALSWRGWTQSGKLGVDGYSFTFLGQWLSKLYFDLLDG